MKFNNVDLDLIVTAHNASNFGQDVNYVQLPDTAYSFGATRTAKPISVEVTVAGTSYADVLSKLDTLKKVLGQRNSCPLMIEADRYYNAVFTSLSGSFAAPTVWQGTIEFICPDPAAYGVTEISNDYTISGTQTITETAGGTGIISPIYTLTANAAVTSVKLENTETLEEIQWTGSLAAGDKLTIDVIKWLVSKNGVPSMGTVVGQFPRLKPGANGLTITGFTGTLNITYHTKWL